MRKIEGAEEIARKDKRRARFFSIFMLLILVGSTVGYAFFYNTPEPSKNKDNGKFYQTGDAWNVNIGGQVFSFSNSPEEVKYIEVNSTLGAGDYSGKPLYIDSKEQGVYTEIASTLGRYAERVQSACYGACNDTTLPEKNCNDNLIIWKESDESRVYQQDQCVFIEGNMKTVDAFLYKILGLA